MHEQNHQHLDHMFLEFWIDWEQNQIQLYYTIFYSYIFQEHILLGEIFFNWIIALENDLFSFELIRNVF